MVESTLDLVSLQTFDALVVLEAELTDVDDWLRGQFLRVGGEVPGSYSIATEFNLRDILHSGDGVVLLGVMAHASRCPQLLGGGWSQRTSQGAG